MNHKRFKSMRTILFLASTILLLSFVIARTLPLQQTRNTAGASGAAPSPTPTPSPSPSRRDLTLYDRAGPFTITPALSKAARNALLAQIRSFLWEHWQQKRRGSLELNSPNAAGRPMTQHFFVEPDASNRWGITLESGGATETFHVVEQVEMQTEVPPVLNPAPGHRLRPSGTLGLHLTQSARANSGLIL